MLENESNTKIVTKEEIKIIVEREKESKKVIVFTNGCFDLIHHVHINLLRQAKRRGDMLVVGINSDESVKRIKGEDRPVMDERERAFVLSALDFVDYIVIFEEGSPVELIRDLRPDILVKGSDYELNEIAGKDIVESYGGKVQIIYTGKRFSTTDLIQKIANRYKDRKDVKYLRMFAIATDSDMQKLVDREYKWLQTYILSLPVVLAFFGTIGNLIKGYEDAHSFFLIGSVILALYLFTLASLICSKIIKENRKYKNYGSQLRRIWKYFNLYDDGAYLKEPILTKKERDYGEGRGYLFSIIMLWVLTVITGLIIVGSGVVCFCTEFLEN